MTQPNNSMKILFISLGCDKNLVDLIFVNRFEDAVPAADHRHAVKTSSPFIGIVVDQTNRIDVELFGILQFPDDDDAGVSRSDNHRILLSFS